MICYDCYMKYINKSINDFEKNKGKTIDKENDFSSTGIIHIIVDVGNESTGYKTYGYKPSGKYCVECGKKL